MTINQNIGGKYFDTETDISVGGYPITIPARATVSKISGEYENIENGIVIYMTKENTIVDWSDIEKIQSEYDQFVWIPINKETAIVEEGKEITGSTDEEKDNSLRDYVSINNKYPMAVKKADGIYSGVLYEFKEENGIVKIIPRAYSPTTSADDYEDVREPDIMTLDLSNSNITKDTMQIEYKEMIERVSSKGGFWIGRYETTNMNSSNFTTNAVNVVKGTTNGINNISWYKMYEGQKSYKDSIENVPLRNSQMKSSMIWGSQWDQIMIWMKDIKNSSNYYIIDSIGQGNYNVRK